MEIKSHWCTYTERSRSSQSHVKPAGIIDRINAQKSNSSPPLIMPRIYYRSNIFNRVFLSLSRVWIYKSSILPNTESINKGLGGWL